MNYDSKNEASSNLERIKRELSEIAFSENEKTADRIKALKLLGDTISCGESRAEAMSKLDDILKSL